MTVFVRNKPREERKAAAPKSGREKLGGGAENRTPVHESPLIGISKLSRWFSLGRLARSDTLATS